MTEPENKPGEAPSPYTIRMLQEFLARAAWSLSTRCQVLQLFAELGDVAGERYVSLQIVAEAKAIASVVTMLMIETRDKE